MLNKIDSSTKNIVYLSILMVGFLSLVGMGAVIFLMYEKIIPEVHLITGLITIGAIPTLSIKTVYKMLKEFIGFRESVIENKKKVGK